MAKQSIYRGFYKATWFVIRPIFKFFTSFQIIFPPDLSLKKPIILASNHLNLYDPFLIGLSFPLSSKIHPLHFMAADGLMNSPLRIFLEFWGCFPAYFGRGLDVSLRIPRQILKQGGTVLIFPQGKRFQGFDIHQGKVGAAALALSTEAPILPMAISDSYPGDIVKFFLKKKKIKISIGRPFSLAEKLDKKENYTKADFAQGTEIIMREISRLFP